MNEAEPEHIEQLSCACNCTRMEEFYVENVTSSVYLFHRITNTKRNMKDRSIMFKKTLGLEFISSMCLSAFT